MENPSVFPPAAHLLLPCRTKYDCNWSTYQRDCSLGRLAGLPRDSPGNTAVGFVDYKGPIFHSIVLEHDNSMLCQTLDAVSKESDEVGIMQVPDDPLNPYHVIRVGFGLKLLVIKHDF